MNVDTLISDSTSVNPEVHSIGDLASRRIRNNVQTEWRHLPRIRGTNYYSPHGRIHSFSGRYETLTESQIHTNETLLSYGIVDSNERRNLLIELGKGDKVTGASVVRDAELMAREYRLAERFPAGLEHARTAFENLARYVAKNGVLNTRNLIMGSGLDTIITLSYTASSHGYIH